jgi:hypothetical protein
MAFHEFCQYTVASKPCTLRATYYPFGLHVLLLAVSTVLINTDLCMEVWWCVIMFWSHGIVFVILYVWHQVIYCIAEGVSETYCGEYGMIWTVGISAGYLM